MDRRIITVCSVLMMLCCMALDVSFANTTTGGQAIKLNLIQPIKQKVSTDAGSVFTDLTPEAVKLGLPDARLYGAIKQEELVDKTTRVFISWHSIGVPTSTGSPLVDNLPTPLKSQLRVKGEDDVKVGEIITARGDLQGVIDKYIELKERLKKEAPKHLVEKEDEEEDDKDSYSADSGGGASAAGGDSRSGGGINSPEFGTNSITSSWEACSPRVAQEEGLVYRRSRKVETDEKGNTVSTGSCEDHGGTVPITKEYGAPCNVIYDFANKKAYEQYREYAVVDGQTIAITNCSNDFTRSYAIYGRAQGDSTCEDCTVRHDFEAGKSIEQQRLYYLNSEGKEIKITDCVDSDKAYKHFLTEATCFPIIDKTKNKATIMKRVAYVLDNGTIQYATDCRAVDGGDVDLHEAICDQKYEHDFKAGQSYLRTRDYYIDEKTKAPVYLTACTRSTTKSFAHIQNSSGCDLNHDDENLQSIQKTSTHIETEDDGKIELSPCQDNGVTIPYTFVGVVNKQAEYTTSGSWVAPKGVTSITVFLVAGGNSGGHGGNVSQSGQDGGGINGGKGMPGTYGTESRCGGGGGAGEQVTKTIDVTPGQTFEFIIGQSDQDTKFGELVARHANGSLYNGAKGTDAGETRCAGSGGNGYGTVKLAQDGVLTSGIQTHYPHMKDMAGLGGIGYGAGGGGGLGQFKHNSTKVATPGGKGAPGFIRVSWAANKYRRCDGTYYVQGDE